MDWHLQTHMKSFCLGSAQQSVMGKTILQMFFVFLGFSTKERQTLNKKDSEDNGQADHTGAWSKVLEMKWVQVQRQALSLPSEITLGKFPNLSEPQFPPIYNGDNNSYVELFQ